MEAPESPCLRGGDEIRDHDDWESIVLLGRYVEISSGPEGDKARSHIRSLLRERPLWWQSGYTIGQVRRQSNAVAAIYYCMRMVDRTAIPLPSGVPTVKILWPLTWGLKPSGDSAPIELIFPLREFPHATAALDTNTNNSSQHVVFGFRLL